MSDYRVIEKSIIDCIERGIDEYQKQTKELIAKPTCTDIEKIELLGEVKGYKNCSNRIGQELHRLLFTVLPFEHSDVSMQEIPYEFEEGDNCITVDCSCVLGKDVQNLIEKALDVLIESSSIDTIFIENIVSNTFINMFDVEEPDCFEEWECNWNSTMTYKDNTFNVGGCAFSGEVQINKN
jgi:hypothetical protein